ncbi:MAG: dockerin-like protein [Sedimentisphaerales bacterium]
MKRLTFLFSTTIVMLLVAGLIAVPAFAAASGTTSATSSGGGCTIPPMPSYSSLPANSYLPDPFKMMDGSRITTKAQWACRRAEIAALSQEFELGVKPGKPSSVTSFFSENSITVTCSEGEKSISFSCSITYPSEGNAPYPAMICVGGSGLSSQLSGLGVAVITFPNNQIAQQTNSGSRGKGKFYDLYGSAHSAGALMAWAWGVDCLIDALETTPAAGIDANRLGVTGCSRNGKGALAVGEFDERIKLTIPQESGAGGAASWRVSDAQKAAGQNVQTLSQIVTENCWFRSDFSHFGSAVNKLPFDHHMIAALCAPRALLFVENTSMEWLGNLSTWTNGNVTHMVWEALGIPDKMGFSQAGHPDHCRFPSSQNPELTAYVQKFLVGGGTGNTTIMKTDSGLTFDKAKWVDWTVPSLQ